MPYTPFSVCIRPLEEDESTEAQRRRRLKQESNMGNCLVSKKTKAREKQTISGGGGGGRGNPAPRGSTAGLTVSNVSAKEYSWSNRERKDLSRYIIENLNDSVEIRLAGEVDGEQFIIQNCCRSTIALYDYSNTVMIDDCTDCTFFVGPVMGSIAIRNCENCRLMSASQQFRTRDCKRLDLFLFCGTQPAIESCSQLRFGCFSANYNGLKDQFSKAGLNVFNNKWSQVYDFSIDDQERHWSTFPADVKATDFFRAVLMGNPMLNLSFNVNGSLVPQTLGVVSLEFAHSRATGVDFYANSSSFDSASASASANQHTLSSLEEGGSRDDSASSARLCLVFVYAHDQDGTIDLDTQRLLQEIAIKHKEAILLMTKSFQPEQVNLKLSLIAAEDAMSGRLQAEENKNKRNNNNSSTNDSLQGTTDGLANSRTGSPPNRLLVLFYQGTEHLTRTLYDSCTHVFGSSSAASSSASFKLVADDNEETCAVFGNYLSIAFENLISY